VSGLVTLREREVLRLIAQGYSNKEAASLLRLSIRTVEKHRERAMGKLNLKSAVELTKYAISHGIIELEGGQGETPANPDE
jgi:DNA-binding NarL/FixJ family response regulator